MVTFTAAHRLEHPLSDTLSRLKKALRAMTAQRAYVDIVSTRTAMVNTTEITWAERNGWHPHSHQAWFWPFRPGPDPEALASRLYPLWQRVCARHGLETLEYYKDRRIGVDVREAWDASEYLAKFDRERDWDLPSEMTAGRLKTGRSGSFTPWGILEEAVIRGKDSRAADLWIEYLRATRGYDCVSLRGARDLLKRYDLPTTYDDWADANAPGEGEVIGTISGASYDRVVRSGGLGRLLEAARTDGYFGLARELGA